MSPEQKPETSWLNRFVKFAIRYLLPGIVAVRLYFDIVNEESWTHPSIDGIVIVLIIGYYAILLQDKFTNKEGK